MDWIRTNPDISLKDEKTLRPGKASSSIVMISRDGQAKKGESKPLLEDQDWDKWFRDGPLDQIRAAKKDGSIAVILGGRIGNDHKDSRNPAALSYLPFSREIFRKIFEQFSLHGSMIRNINRGLPTFSRTYLKMGNKPEPAIGLLYLIKGFIYPVLIIDIVYNCRSYNGWPGDLALSITYFIQTNTTYGIVLGCNNDTTKEISGRLVNSDETACHPLLLVGVFCEIERKRHIKLVNEGLEDLLRTVSSLGRHGTEWNDIAPHESESRHAIDPWLEIHYIKNGLQNWREQLSKMVRHVDELPAKWEPFASIEARERAKESGARIQERLKEIMNDYDEKIRECEMIMEGMTLATSLAHTKANMDIALSTKKDGSQMKSIALLTMVFLPATFVASLFSMTFFQWIPEDSSETVSPYLWIYFVVTAGLTLITVGLWYLFANRKKEEGTTDDPEKGMGLKQSMASLATFAAMKLKAPKKVE